MSHVSRRARPWAALLCAGLLLGACSGGDDDDAVAAGGTDATAATDDAAVTEPTGATTTSVAPGPAEGDPVPSAGCGTTTTGAVREERRTLDVDGTERWYLLTTPEAHDGATPLPLVLDIHGLAEGAQIHAAMTAYSDLAEAEGFVVAFPNGTGEPVRWNINLEGATPNADVAFLSDLLDTLGDDLCLDTSRVYATGLSNGAMMSSVVGCTLADRVAAIAPIAGIEDPAGCDPARPLPVLAEHGGADPILGFNGGVGVIPGILGEVDPNAPPTTMAGPDLDGAGYPATVAAWAERNGCGDPTDTTLEDATDEIVHRVYDCPAGADVELYVVVEGGHSWPGSEFSRSIEAIVGYTTFDLDATALAWEFFQRFQLPAD